MGASSSGPVRRVVGQQAAVVKDAVRGSQVDPARPTAIQRSRARRALRREVRTQQEGLSRTWMFTGRRDRLLGGLAGIAVVAAAAVIIWLGGGDGPVGATGYSPSVAPTVSPTPLASESSRPSVTPTPTPKATQKPKLRQKPRQQPGGGANRTTSGGSAGTGTDGTSGGTSGSGGSGGSATQSPRPDPEPEPTQTKPGPTK